MVINKKLIFEFDHNVSKTNILLKVESRPLFFFLSIGNRILI